MPGVNGERRAKAWGKETFSYTTNAAGSSRVLDEFRNSEQEAPRDLVFVWCPCAASIDARTESNFDRKSGYPCRMNGLDRKSDCIYKLRKVDPEEFGLVGCSRTFCDG